MPGPWAPSTSTSTPRSARAGTSRSSGMISAVGLVTWSRIASFVRGVTAAMTASKASSGDEMGNGTRASAAFAPSFAAP